MADHEPAAGPDGPSPDDGWLPAFRRSGGPTPAGTALTAWHAGLIGTRPESWARDTAGRAALRRAADLDDVLIGAAGPLERLRRGLVGPVRLRQAAYDALARVAATVAEIDADLPEASLGARLAGAEDGRPAVSLARMRLLLATDEPEMFVRLLRGLLPLIERRAPVVETADLVRRWHSPPRRAEARRSLMRAYIESVPDDVLK